MEIQIAYFDENGFEILSAIRFDCANSVEQTRKSIWECEKAKQRLFQGNPKHNPKPEFHYVQFRKENGAPLSEIESLENLC